VIVFTVLGYWVALCGAFELGRYLAMGVDARRAYLKFDRQVSEIEGLCAALAVYASGVPEGVKR
jgi:hypothetical protein